MFVNWKRMLLTLYRIEEQQQEILAELQQLRKQAVQPSEGSPSGDREPDKWIQEGIDNIMSFQVGKKSGERE